MPFTALHPELGLFDPTLSGLGHDLGRGQVHKVHPRVLLTASGSR